MRHASGSPPWDEPYRCSRRFNQSLRCCTVPACSLQSPVRPPAQDHGGTVRVKADCSQSRLRRGSLIRSAASRSADRPMPDQAKQLSSLFAYGLARCQTARKEEGSRRVVILSDASQTEILRRSPAHRGCLSNQSDSSCRSAVTDVENRFITCHPIEHDGPQLGNSLEKTAIIGRPQSSHHRRRSDPSGPIANTQ